MATKIKGITVTLWNPTETGVDPFGEPTYSLTPEAVDNIVVSPTSAQEILDAINIYGKKAVYTLAIPKGDEHDWEDKKVSFFGKDWRVFGIPLEGIEENIPLDWNKKVTVEIYE